MLDYILLSLVCIISIEAIKQFKLIVYTNGIISIFLRIKKVVFSKNISDAWKQVALPTYACKIMQYSLKIITIFLFIFIFILIIDAIFDGFLKFLLSLTGIVASVIIGTFYISARDHILK